eukprot:snap_masked-scaffold_9-processed-gene-0.8-mRNA-1 protein AED:0.40 eAED:0.40 QI:0/-1/0/1/-1/1/1/0/300
MNKYTVEETLGSGTYGEVARGREVGTGRLVALKAISLENDETGFPATAIREIGILRRLNHPNIVPLLDVIMEERRLVMVLELMEMDLKIYMDNYVKGLTQSVGLPPNLVQSLARQLFKGLAHVHENKIMHRDLKPQNLLLNSDGVLKIADFGLSRSFQLETPSFANEIITLWYRPPEVLLGSVTYDSSVDIWSAGCIFAEMAMCKPLFYGTNESRQLQEIFIILGTPNAQSFPTALTLPKWKNEMAIVTFTKKSLDLCLGNLHPAGVDLLRRTLMYEPSRRNSAQMALRHVYFSTILEGN